jgi:hypothetical protein
MFPRTGNFNESGTVADSVRLGGSGECNATGIFGLTATFTRIGKFTGSGTGRFTTAVSSPADEGQMGGTLGMWPLVGIAVGALVLIVGVSLVVWGVRRRRSVSVTSSIPAEMNGASLTTTEDIDFGVKTYESVTMANDIGTDLNVVDADETMTTARKLIDDFL